MKRFLQLGLVGALTLAMAATAVAQQVPTQVTRMGDWVEISNDVFMNIIASTEFIFQTTENTDFEKDIRDRTPARANQSTVPHYGTGDILWEESRLGMDFRYRKNLTMRVLFESQMTIDGNRIDNGIGSDAPTDMQTFDDGRNLACGTDGNGCDQRNTINLERAWMNYQFPDTPLAIEVGARLWTTDPAGVIGDDDPRFAVFLDLGPLQLEAAAVLQTESLRIGLTNDNDDVYYTFGASYDLKPIEVGLNVAYFRYRFEGARGRTDGQEIDSVTIMPNVTGAFGPVSFLVQPMLVAGEAKGGRDTAGNRQDYDIFSYGFIGQVQVNLGIVRPFLAVVFGSGDDDPDDDDLEGFAAQPQREITLTTGQRYFTPLTRSSSWGARDVFPPAALNLGTGFEFMHTVGNPWHDRINPQDDLASNFTLANPGTLLLAPGVSIFPFKGHQADLFYIYRRVIDSEPLERVLLNQTGLDINVDESMTHELALMYTWSPNPHFNIQAFGAIIIPSDGVKDIASAQDCNFDVAGRQPCDGEDVALRASIRFRAQF